MNKLSLILSIFKVICKVHFCSLSFEGVVDWLMVFWWLFEDLKNKSIPGKLDCKVKFGYFSRIEHAKTNLTKMSGKKLSCKLCLVGDFQV